jgi:hypothetical protein
VARQAFVTCDAYVIIDDLDVNGEFGAIVSKLSRVTYVVPVTGVTTPRPVGIHGQQATASG